MMRAGLLPTCAHVREGDPVGIGTQPGLQQFDPVGVDEDEGGLVGGQAFAEEGKGCRDELVIAGIEEGLVTKPRSAQIGRSATPSTITERTPTTRGVRTGLLTYWAQSVGRLAGPRVRSLYGGDDVVANRERLAAMVLLADEVPLGLGFLVAVGAAVAPEAVDHLGAASGDDGRALRRDVEA